jgi:hypothetical protein
MLPLLAWSTAALLTGLLSVRLILLMLTTPLLFFVAVLMLLRA